MQPMRLFPALAGLVVIGLSSGAALAQAPPSCGYGGNTNPDELDKFIMSGWGCGPPGEILGMLRDFEFHQDDWDDGFGWNDFCDNTKPMARTLNALQLLKYSHSNTSTPNCAGSGGNFLDWVYCWAGNSIEELEGRCEHDPPGPAAYTQWFGFSEWTHLYMPFFYKVDVVERASYIVHEAKHAEDGCKHLNPCCDREVSCDSDYWNNCNNSGGPNAFQVIFLSWYAATANWPTEDPEGTGISLEDLKARAVELANAILKDGFCHPPCFRLDSNGWPFATCFEDDWHGIDLTEQVVDSPSTIRNRVAGYATTLPPAQHVVFVGYDAFVHELVFTDHWEDNNLMVDQPDTLDAPPPALGSSLAGYVVSGTSPQQQHVVYISADGHVNELMYDTAWHWKDLTQDSDAPPAVVTSPLTGYETTYGTGQHHINFIDAEQGHVYELFINIGDTQWQKNDLTDIARKDDRTSPPAPRANSPLTGYQTAWNGAQHVNFIDADSGHLWELYFTTSWYALDLTANAGAVVPNATSPLTAYTTDFFGGNQQHVLFIDGNNHVREMYFRDSLPWQSFDLNEQAGIPDVLAATTALHGYTLTYTVPHQQHVNFVSASDGHIRELYFDENTHWHARDLTQVAVPKANLPTVGSQLSGYQTPWDSSQHINFIDADGHISELYRVR